MARWKIIEGRTHKPEPGSDRATFARSYTIEGDGVTIQTTIEFDDLAKANMNEASRIIKPLLDTDDPPPRRLLVGRDGTASVLEEQDLPEHVQHEALRKHDEQKNRGRYQH